MTLVDKLNRMAPPEKPKSPDQQRYEQYMEQAFSALEQQCTKDRARRSSSGYLVMVTGDEYFGGNDVTCSPKLYAHEYPYKVDVGDSYRLTKSTRSSELQLYFPFQSGTGYNAARPLDTERAFCDRLAKGLREKLRKEGFVRVELAPVPVYTVEVKRYRRSGLFNAAIFEEGRLTNQVAGYVISFELAW